MKMLFVGGAMTVAAWIWLLRACSWGESPFHYALGQAWYDPGSNLNFVLYNAFALIAHAILGAGIALAAIRHGSRRSQADAAQRSSPPRAGPADR